VVKILLEYREVLISEVAEVAILHNELAYFLKQETEDAYWDFGVLSEENISKHLVTFIGDSQRKIFISRDDEKIVGFIVCEVIQCHLHISTVKKIGYISGAYVLPEFRGKGIMKLLEILAIDFFKQSGLKYVEVNFLSRNIIANKSWKSMGYKTFREQARKEI